MERSTAAIKQQPRTQSSHRVSISERRLANEDGRSRNEFASNSIGRDCGTPTEIQQAVSPGRPQTSRDNRKGTLCLIEREFENSCQPSAEHSYQVLMRGENDIDPHDSRESSSPKSLPLIKSVGRHMDDGDFKTALELNSEAYSSDEKHFNLEPLFGVDKLSFQHKNPLKWTTKEVEDWLDIMEKMYSISNLDKRKFSMNGLGVALIPKKGFVKRLGQYGTLLYQDYHRRLEPVLPSLKM